MPSCKGGCVKVLVGVCDSFGLFVEFLCYVLLRDCILGFFCELKEGLCGEIKCLTFKVLVWKKKNGRVTGLFEEK